MGFFPSYDPPDLLSVCLTKGQGLLNLLGESSESEAIQVFRKVGKRAGRQKQSQWPWDNGSDCVCTATNRAARHP